MWRLPPRRVDPLRDGALLEAWCVGCGALRAMPEQILSRAIRGDLPRDFDVHRHCVIACPSCGAIYLVDTWYALPRAPWVAEGDPIDAAVDTISRGANRAADAVENGVRWAMGHKPKTRSDARASSAADDRDLDAARWAESSLLEDPIEAKFRALEEAAKKKP